MQSGIVFGKDSTHALLVKLGDHGGPSPALLAPEKRKFREQMATTKFSQGFIMFDQCRPKGRACKIHQNPGSAKDPDIHLQRPVLDNDPNTAHGHAPTQQWHVGPSFHAHAQLAIFIHFLEKHHEYNNNYDQSWIIMKHCSTEIQRIRQRWSYFAIFCVSSVLMTCGHSRGTSP